MSPRCACANDHAWGILRGDKLHRVTFSRSLAEYIISRLGGACSLTRITFAVGVPLAPGAPSSQGLYAIVSTKGRVLRVSLHREVAELFRDPSRTIQDCRIVAVQPVSKEIDHVEEPRSEDAAAIEAA